MNNTKKQPNINEFFEDGKTWRQEGDLFLRCHDNNFEGIGHWHRRCPFCQRLIVTRTRPWSIHLEKCAPPEYSLKDIDFLRHHKLGELKGRRVGRKQRVGIIKPDKAQKEVKPSYSYTEESIVKMTLGEVKEALGKITGKGIVPTYVKIPDIQLRNALRLLSGVMANKKNLNRHDED